MKTVQLSQSGVEVSTLPGRDVFWQSQQNDVLPAVDQYVVAGGSFRYG
jgi:hypothetical protein